MGLWKNFKTVVSNKITGAPLGNQEVDISQINMGGAKDPRDQEAVFPAWFFSSRLKHQFGAGQIQMIQ